MAVSIDKTQITDEQMTILNEKFIFKILHRMTSSSSIFYVYHQKANKSVCYLWKLPDCVCHSDEYQRYQLKQKHAENIFVRANQEALHVTWKIAAPPFQPRFYTEATRRVVVGAVGRMLGCYFPVYNE